MLKKDNNFLLSLVLDKDYSLRANTAIKLFGKRHYYIQSYKKFFLEHLRDEYNKLKAAFPEVEFIPEARIKSQDSYNNKVREILDSGFFKDIYDIFGSRYIIISVNGSRKEEDIVPILYKMKNYLSYGFEGSENIEERFKDYVSHPRHSSYQSLHISRLHFIKNNVSYQSETQLRSYFMHYNAHSGAASHANSYKERIPGVTDIPDILEYVFDDNGNCIEVKVESKEKAFEDFFGIPYTPDNSSISNENRND